MTEFLLNNLFLASLKFEMKYITEKFGDCKKQENGNKYQNQNEMHQYSLPRTKNHACLIKYHPV